MDIRRFAALILIVAISFAAIIMTGPGVINNVKLGLDLKGGFEILYEAEPIEEGKQLTRDVLTQAAKSLAQRANATGVEEPEVTPELPNRIRVRLAGVTDQEQVRDRLKEPAVLTFRSSDGCADPYDFCKIELQGTDFVEGGASVQYDSTTNMPYVAIKVKEPDKFEEITGRLASQYGGGNILAIYLDENQISAPGVNGRIPGGTASITGNYNHQEAKELADTINLGALPVKLTERYTQSVGATLGMKSLEQTLTAGIIGSLIVLLFMLVYYRLPGLIACITLITYTWLVLVVFNLMNATLTLPGIAAFVLGIGMAVDANIITYERIKEEIRSGKSIMSSLRAGSRNSLRTILDANITTILAGVVLYYVGTGAIQGFALTLIFSIIVSMITNVLFSRLLLYLLIRSNIANKPAYYGVKESEISEL